MERYRAGFLAFVAFLLLGLLTITFVIWAALCSVHAAETDKCGPFDKSVEAIVQQAQKTGSRLAIIPPPMMAGFLVGLGDKGKGITGESALVVLSPNGGFALFVKRGDTLCLAISEDGNKPPDRDL